MKNRIIKEALFETGIRQYELSAILGVSESTVWRKIRTELPEEDQRSIAKKIYEEAARRQQS